MFPGYPGDPSVFQVERARDRRDDVFRMVRDKHHLHAAAGQRVEQEAEALTGSPVRLILRTGEAPKSSPEENLKNLVAFGQQFDNIEIK